MRREPVIGVQPEIMRWARQTIGLSISDVAHAIKKSIEKIEAWEDGTDAPSYVELEKLAYKVYKRPLAVFFLPEPPEEVAPERKFRTLPQSDLQTLAADTYLQIRKAQAFQLALKEVFGSHKTDGNCIWQSIKLSRSGSVIDQANAIRKFLGITIENQITWKIDELALKKWRQAIEDAGVFVFKAAFKQKDISSFCLVDRDFPVVYLNNSTTKTRQIFSLLHELAHLLLSINGLSKFDKSYIDRLPFAEKQIERFCNAIAAEVLIPSDDFQKQIAHFPANVENTSEQHFDGLATRYGVSREAILRRFLDQGRVGAAFYEHKAKQWAAQKKETSGGNWYASQNIYLSDRFAKEVVSRYYRHQITLEQASEFLGIRAKNFAGLEQRMLQGAEA